MFYILAGIGRARRDSTIADIRSDSENKVPLFVMKNLSVRSENSWIL